MNEFNYRSPVLGKHACIVCDQPLGSKIGYDILKKGGNAADAAIAMAAAVGFLSPFSSGLGGDCFILYYSAKDHSVTAINGSGKSSKEVTKKRIEEAGFSLSKYKTQFDLDVDIKKSNCGIFINVPGFVMGISDLFENFGSKKLSLNDLFDPTMKLAANGTPASLKTAIMMKSAFSRLKTSSNVRDMFKKPDGPMPGSIIQVPKLAESLKNIANDGPKAFYCGKMAENIVQAVQNAGGALTMDDMKHHFDESQKKTSHRTPLYKDFYGFRIWEMPPNTTGIVVLRTLKLLEKINLKELGHNSAEYIHTVSEALKESFLSCWDYLCDPDYKTTDYNRLISSENPPEKIPSIKKASNGCNTPTKKSSDISNDTSYVTAIDEEGNACSLIFSIFTYFGSTVIPPDCGFILHDRGKLFSFDENSPNRFGPRKRSLHTIIPALITDSESGELNASFGLIGGWMQPQGHIQILLNMILFGMNPQVALDQPRFSIGNTNLLTGFRDSLYKINLEDGIPQTVALKLKEMQHEVTPNITGVKRHDFGVGQIIAKQKLWSREFDEESANVLWAGSDLRSDGIAIGY